MGQLYSFVKENKKMVGLATVTAIGATATVVYNKRKQYMSQSEIYKTPKTLDDEYFPPKRSAFQFEDREDTLYTRISKSGKIDQILDTIRVNYIADTECLDPQTVVDILQNTTEIAGDEFIKMTLKNRVSRRSFKEHQKFNQYRHQILKYNEDLEELLEKAQAELLTRLDINKAVFEESMLVLMERGFFQQLYMLQACVKQKIKEKIPSRRDLNIKQIKEVIKYNIKILKEQPDPLRAIVNSMKSKDQKEYIPNAISLLVQDFIYEKFRIEEEDQIRNISKPECMGDPEIHQLLGEIEQTMNELMQSLGVGMENIPDCFENFA